MIHSNKIFVFTFKAIKLNQFSIAHNHTTKYISYKMYLVLKTLTIILNVKCYSHLYERKPKALNMFF